MGQNTEKRNVLGDVVKNIKITGSFVKKGEYTMVHRAEVILTGEWLVTSAKLSGGSNHNGDYWPHGWCITLTKLNTKGNMPNNKILANMQEHQMQSKFGSSTGWLFDKQVPGMTVTFYQNSLCYTGEGYFDPVRKMKQVWVDTK